MTIIPAPGFILIEILDEKGKTDQGIYVPQDQSEPMRGKVLAVGEVRPTEEGYSLIAPIFKVNNKSVMIKPDDIIFFKPHTAQNLPGYAEKKQAFCPFEVIMGLEVHE